MKQLITKQQFRVIQEDLIYIGGIAVTYLMKLEIDKLFENAFTFAISIEANERVYIIKKAKNQSFAYEVYTLK